MNKILVSSILCLRLIYVLQLLQLLQFSAFIEMILIYHSVKQK